MASNDRSIGLADLAARAQSAPPTGRRARSDCRNPECNNGMTPGLVAAGGGNKAQPLFGAGGVGAKRLMRWAWVRCLACNAPEDARKAGAVYRPLSLDETQIAQRAQLANSKAPYQAQEPRTTLHRAPAPGMPSVDSAKLTEMIEQNKQLSARLDELLKQNVAMTDTLSRMTMQVASLLEDNAKLREQLSKSVTVPQSLIKACAENPT
jgi:hypothetical protein